MKRFLVLALLPMVFSNVAFALQVSDLQPLAGSFNDKARPNRPACVTREISISQNGKQIQLYISTGKQSKTYVFDQRVFSKEGGVSMDGAVRLVINKIANGRLIGKFKNALLWRDLEIAVSGDKLTLNFQDLTKSPVRGCVYQRVR